MAEEHPSYLTSTTSQVLFVACAAYIGTCVVMVFCGLWRNQVAFVDVGRTGLEGVLIIFLVLYGIRKGIEIGQPQAPK